jgi:hypothetical protein
LKYSYKYSTVRTFPSYLKKKGYNMSFSYTPVQNKLWMIFSQGPEGLTKKKKMLKWSHPVVYKQTEKSFLFSIHSKFVLMKLKPYRDQVLQYLFTYMWQLDVAMFIFIHASNEPELQQVMWQKQKVTLNIFMYFVCNFFLYIYNVDKGKKYLNMNIYFYFFLIIWIISCISCIKLYKRILL